MRSDKEHNNIRKFRENLGMSQTAMAEELGIGRTSYVNFESGKIRMFCKTLSKMAEYSGRSELELLLGVSDVNALFEKEDQSQLRAALVEDYERRLAELRERCSVAEELVKTHEQTIKALTQTNSYLISRLNKED